MPRNYMLTQPDFSVMVPDVGGAQYTANALLAQRQQRQMNAMALEEARDARQRDLAWQEALTDRYPSRDARIAAITKIDPERAERFTAGLMQTEEARASREARNREIALTGLRGILGNAKNPKEAAEGWQYFQGLYPQTDLSGYAPREWTPEGIEMQMGMLGATAGGDPFTLSPGEVRFDPSGRPIASVDPSQSSSAAASIQEYRLWAGQQPPEADRSFERFLKVKTTATTRPQAGAGQYTMQDVRALNADWQKAIQPTRDLQRQIDLMEVGIDQARQGNMTAGSQAVLVTFQKILDPTSVVRESEYARSASGLAVIDQIQGAYERLARGGAGVPLQQLEQFYRLGKEAVEKLNTGYVEDERARIGEMADFFGVPKSQVFEGSAARQTRQGSPPPALRLPDGTTLTRQPDGSYR